MKLGPYKVISFDIQRLKEFSKILLPFILSFGIASPTLHADKTARHLSSALF